jgi:hypothetical protein
MNLTDHEILITSEAILKRIISKEKWFDLVEDFRDDEGIAKHFGLSLVQLQLIKQHWDL